MSYLSTAQKSTITSTIFALIAIPTASSVAYFNTETDHELLVKGAEWCYIIQIQELEQQHEEGWSIPPHDAYDISRMTKRHGTIKIGDTEVPRYDTWYSYSIDRWIDTRTVVTNGFDKEPYWGDCNLKEGDDPRGLGSERVCGNHTVYTVFGVDSTSDTGCYVDVSMNIWGTVEPGNSITYKTKPGGDLYDIKIKEN